MTAAIIYCHNDCPPKLGCLQIDFVRSVDGNALVENELCEGYYHENKNRYDCMLLHLDKGKLLSSNSFFKICYFSALSDKSKEELADNVLTPGGKKDLKKRAVTIVKKLKVCVKAYNARVAFVVQTVFRVKKSRWIQWSRQTSLLTS